MEITPEQFATIEHCLPKQRGNVSLSNLQVVNAILYVAEHGCKWRGLPKRFGNWHTIYTRMNRWTKAGVLDRMFEELQRAQVVRIKIEAVSLDSTSIQRAPRRRQIVGGYVTSFFCLVSATSGRRSGSTMGRAPPRLLSCSSARSDQFRMTLVPGRGFLVGQPSTQQGLLVQRPAADLHADRQPILGETTGQVQRG